MNNFLVYKHTNLINNKSYIGITSLIDNPNLRWKNGNGYYHQPKFYNAILEYGWKNFSHEILETDISPKEIDQKEQYYIQLYDSINNGYNISPGGNAASEETKEKISKALTGITRSKESIEQQIQTKKDVSGFACGFDPKDTNLTKKVKCKETGDIFCSSVEANNWANTSKVGNCCRGEREHAGTHPITGQILSWEFAKENDEITIRCIEKRIPKQIKKIQCIETGEIFNNASEAHRQTGITISNILKVCKGERKSAGKLHWKFYEEGD